jgi:opacity protein-like surface antigen
MKHTALRTLGVMTLAALPAVSTAQMLEPGWTFEVAVGKAKFKDVSATAIDDVARNFFDSFALPVQTLTSSLGYKDRSYALISGYSFYPWLSVEAGLFRLGAFQYQSAGTVNDAGTLRPATFNFSYRAKGVLVGATASLPVGDYLTLRARAGMTNSDARVRISATVATDAVQDEVSNSSQDFYYGVGVGMKVWDYYRVGIDWMSHSKFGKASGSGTTDIDNVLLSFTYTY